MNTGTPKTRQQILCEKLGNFFQWLLDDPAIQRTPKAVKAITDTAQVALAIDKSTGLSPGYGHICDYVSQWIEPAFEWVEVSQNYFDWRLKDGNRLMDLANPKSEIVTHREWLIINNVKYYDIDFDRFSEIQRKKMFDYLRCFLKLTSPFTNDHKRDMERKAERIRIDNLEKEKNLKLEELQKKESEKPKSLIKKTKTEKQ